MLGLTVYLEAASEGIEGMLAVASVVINRAKKVGKAPKDLFVWDFDNPFDAPELEQDIDDVTLARYQFSCYNAGTESRIRAVGIALDWDRQEGEDYYLRASHIIAQLALQGVFRSNVGNATLYYNPDLAKPKWDFGKLKEICRIKHHLFFEEK